jgi:hypothetical protein
MFPNIEIFEGNKAGNEVESDVVAFLRRLDQDKYSQAPWHMQGSKSMEPRGLLHAPYAV